MKKARHIVGQENGKSYTLVFQTYSAQGMAVDDRYANTWRWFLTIDGDYIGDFDSKSRAVSQIRSARQ